MRLTPTVAFVSLVYFNLAQLFVHHAPYAFNKDLVEPFEEYWWSLLLHLQVYANPLNLVSRQLLLKDILNVSLTINIIKLIYNSIHH